MDISTGNIGPKSFWSRPEGKTGLIFGAGLFGLLGWGLYKILPYAIKIMSNLLHLSLLAIGFGALMYVVFDPKFRSIIWYLYRSLMRAVTGIFVTIDPIGIAKNYIKHLRERLVVLGEQIGSVKEQIRAVDSMIQQNNKEVESSMEIMSQAKKTGNSKVVVFQSRKAGRRQESTLSLQKMKERLELVYRVLIKLAENAELVADDKEDEVKQREREFRAMKASRSALRAAIGVLNGDPDKLDIFEQAMEHMTNDIALAYGEIDTFLDTSRGFLDSLDLQSMSFEEDGLKMLEEWEKKSDTFLLKPEEKQLLLAESTSPLTPLRIVEGDPVPVRRKPDTSIDDFLNF